MDNPPSLIWLTKREQLDAIILRLQKIKEEAKIRPSVVVEDFVQSYGVRIMYRPEPLFSEVEKIN